MYTTHNDLVVRTVDLNGEPIRGASVRVTESMRVIESPTKMVRKKRDDVASQDPPKFDYDEKAKHFAVESPRDSLEAAGKVDNMYDYAASRSSDSSMSESDTRDDVVIKSAMPTNAADPAMHNSLDEAATIVDADTDNLRDTVGDNSDAMATNDDSDEDEMYRDNRELHKSQLPNDVIGTPPDEESTNFEDDSDVMKDIDENEIDSIDNVRHKDRSTNELGEVTFPRRPVGTTFVIEAKAEAGYDSRPA